MGRVWEPDGAETPRNAIDQAIGAASMCWEYPEKAGEFISDRAKWISDGLQEYLQKFIDKNMTLDGEETIGELKEKVKSYRFALRCILRECGGEVRVSEKTVRETGSGDVITITEEKPYPFTTFKLVNSNG